MHIVPLKRTRFEKKSTKKEIKNWRETTARIVDYERVKFCLNVQKTNTLDEFN